MKVIIMLLVSCNSGCYQLLQGYHIIIMLLMQQRLPMMMMMMTGYDQLQFKAVHQLQFKAVHQLMLLMCLYYMSIISMQLKHYHQVHRIRCNIGYRDQTMTMTMTSSFPVAGGQHLPIISSLFHYLCDHHHVTNVQQSQFCILKFMIMLLYGYHIIMLLVQHRVPRLDHDHDHDQFISGRRWPILTNFTIYAIIMLLMFNSHSSVFGYL